MQTLLIQLTVSLGLLAVASLVVDFLALSVCPARAVVAQYKTRTTGRFSTLRCVLDEDMTQKVRGLSILAAALAHFPIVLPNYISFCSFATIPISCMMSSHQ